MLYRIGMPYNAFIPRIDFAATPGIDFRKSGYRSCVPCERHNITLIISNRYRNIPLCWNSELNIFPMDAGRCCFHASDSGAYSVSATINTATGAPTKKTDLQPKDGVSVCIATDA